MGRGVASRLDSLTAVQQDVKQRPGAAWEAGKGAGAGGAHQLPSTTRTVPPSCSRSTFSAAQRAASGDVSTAHTRTSSPAGSMRPSATASAPLPVPRSTHGAPASALPSRRAAASTSSAKSTISSVSGRGMRQPGPTASTRSRQWQLPSRYWIGTRSCTRCFHMARSWSRSARLASCTPSPFPDAASSRCSCLHGMLTTPPSLLCSPAIASSTSQVSSTCSSLGVGSSLLPAALPENTAAPWAAASLSHRRSSANSMRYRGSRSASGVACSSGSNLTLVTERLGSADSAKPRLVGSSDGIAPTRAPTRAFVGVTTCRQSAAGRDPRHGAAGRPRPSAALALRPQLRQGSRLAHCILRHQRADGIADRVTRVPARAGLGQTPRTLMKANQM
mmetsp:Transcript_15436/g.39878  ORF Transcript_15436/g.39878 Transcript_15436/m.39878 type:complete len:390 (-) Transcript_15436:61-1230(-)